MIVPKSVVEKRIETHLNKVERNNVIDFLLRNYSIFDWFIEDKGDIVDFLTEKMYVKVSERVNVDLTLTHAIIERFLSQLIGLRSFLNANKIPWNHDLERLKRIVRAYLHKVFRVAPVFDYKRARVNLDRLYSLLSKNTYWPKIGIQLALVIFVTDKNSPESKKLLQKNIRALCYVSAYAFHRARNILSI